MKWLQLELVRQYERTFRNRFIRTITKEESLNRAIQLYRSLIAADKEYKNNAQFSLGRILMDFPDEKSKEEGRDLMLKGSVIFNSAIDEDKESG